MSKVVNGISVQHFISGWWGEHDEDKESIRELGLPLDEMPFDVERFLQRKTICFKDGYGEKISVCFKKHDTHFEFGCIYKDKKRSVRLYREWETEALDTIIQLESWSIGDCTRRIIVGKSLI